MRTVDQAVLDRLIFFLLDSPLRVRVYDKLEVKIDEHQKVGNKLWNIRK